MMEAQKACDDALEMGLDLEQIYIDRDPEFFYSGACEAECCPALCSRLSQAVKWYRIRELESSIVEWLNRAPCDFSVTSIDVTRNTLLRVKLHL